MIVGGLNQRPQGLGKASAAKAGAGMQEFRPDSVIEPDPACNFLHIRAHSFAQIRDFIDEADLGGKECIGGLLDQVGRSAAGVKYGSLVEVERPVNFSHNFFGALIVCPNDNSIGVFEIVDGGTFPQKFWVRHYRDIEVSSQLPQNALDLVTSPDRHGRLGDYHSRLS